MEDSTIKGGLNPHFRPLGAAVLLCYSGHMVHAGDHTHWRTIVQDFSRSLAEEGFFSVKDVCRFLLDERWDDTEQVLSYLRDYQQISLAHQDFHRKWAHLSNMTNIADYDRQEAEKVGKLMELLQRAQR